ncbi:MAG: hypothetical protein KKC51_15730 [Verrucomicrobia bacterium]|nr:hypothetical protein [Verrucomicrobiota bacterium]
MSDFGSSHHTGLPFCGHKSSENMPHSEFNGNPEGAYRSAHTFLPHHKRLHAREVICKYFSGEMAPVSGKEKIMTIRCGFRVFAASVLWLACAFHLYADTGEETMEISTKPDVISCIYSGVKEAKGAPVVTLQLKNVSEKEITNLLAGFRIYKKGGDELVYTTGVTYGFPIKPGEMKEFTLFRYLPMKENVRKALVDEESDHEVKLVVDEISYAD